MESQPEPEEEGAAATRRAALAASSASHANMCMPAAPTSPAQAAEGEALLAEQERKWAIRRSMFANSSALHHSMFIVPEAALEPEPEPERWP